MKKATLFVLLMTSSVFGYSQDWFGLDRYKVDNGRIITSGEFPDVVFMGNSITENWVRYHPEFFTENNFCGRGISGQVSAQMLVRFKADVIDLRPKAVVIMAGTNDVAHNQYYVNPEQVVANIAAMCELAQVHGIVPIISSITPCAEFPWKKVVMNAGQTIFDINQQLKEYAEANHLMYVDYHSALTDDNLGMPASLSADGCHPDPDTYYLMEDLVMEALGKLDSISTQDNHD